MYHHFLGLRPFADGNARLALFLAALAAHRLGLPPLALALLLHRDSDSDAPDAQGGSLHRSLGPCTRPAADVRRLAARPCDLRPLARLCTEARP